MAKKAGNTGRPDVVVVNPAFTRVFWVLVAVLAFSGIAMAYVSSFDEPNKLQSELFDFCGHAAELVLGGLLGLIAGRSLDQFAHER